MSFGNGPSTHSDRPLTAVIQARERRDVDALVAALSDTDHNVRRLAADALLQLASPKALEPLLRLARDSNDLPLRMLAIKGVAAIGDPEAAPTLVEIATHEERLDLRTTAIAALIELGDQSASQLLADLVASDEAGRIGPRPAFARSYLRWSLDQLVTLKAADTIPRIEEALPGLRFRDRSYARRALRRLRPG